MNESSRRLLDFLSRPQSYPHGPAQVSMVQTHASWVFIAAPLVCKIKKPVNLGFLDFSTLELRHKDCEREVTLNRLLAEDVYLGVESIRQRGGELHFGGEGEVVEWCVMMRELDPRGLLSHRLKEKRKVDTADIDRITEKLLRYHAAQAPLKQEEAATAIERLKLATDGNLDIARPWIGKSLSQPCYETMVLYTDEFFSHQRARLQSRIDGGWIRDCHGDLHAEHIHLSPDAVRIYDCIEFNTRFRHIDVANDIAFLAMDLEFNGRPDLARHFVNRFAASMHDDGMMPLLDFYKCYRACVRGKVESLHSVADTADEAERTESLALARRYFRLALRYAIAGSEPCIFVFMGRVASGKSSLAEAFGQELGWSVVSSDVIRKQIAQVPPAFRGAAEALAQLYSPSMTDRTYGALLDAASRSIHADHGVILDATFSRAVRRRTLGDLAQRMGFRVIWIEVVVSDAVATQRLRERDFQTDVISDARRENAAELNSAYEAPEEITDRITLRSEGEKASVLRKLLRELAMRRESLKSR
ncbi:MAG TPA: AAA family ATPase [Verrucomicrobiaceae bacterium]|jgi:hypothetical protein